MELVDADITKEDVIEKANREASLQEQFRCNFAQELVKCINGTKDQRAFIRGHGFNCLPQIPFEELEVI